MDESTVSTKNELNEREKDITWMAFQLLLQAVEDKDARLESLDLQDLSSEEIFGAAKKITQS